ncbi:MAG: thermonuclease family protein [Oricola sp.]
MRRDRRSVARRLLEFAGTFALFLGVAFAAAILDGRSMRELTGSPRVADGDTLAFSGRRVRLAGIDAPELHQTCRRDGAEFACGQEARAYLTGLLRQGEAVCRGNEEDRYGRLLVRCVCAKTDLNAAMVRAGWAVSHGGYLREEQAARNDAAGLWAGSFERPAEWRELRGGIAELGPAGMATRLFNRVKKLCGIETGEDIR